ncbi:MAG: peptide ABC transporter substrate-binding protein [Oscillospiraceae bacterium]|jgi:oligopeptide transport system substrate-binding protein|nr:peptide ABC transporter substrate-binding protein [Oscillospiraceae bacterium]
MKNRKFIAVFAVLAMLFAYASAGAAEEAAAFNLNVSIASEPATIDPALNSAVDGAVMLSHLFEGLVKLVEAGDGGSAWAPGAAESWDVTDVEDGGTVWTFHLRKDVLWSDGKPLTAHDFVYAWQRLANPETTADYSYMLDTVKGWYDIQDGADPSTLGVKAVDDYTFEVSLITSVPYFLDVAGFPSCFPVRQDAIEAGGDQWTFDPATYLTNGPYKLAEWVHSEKIILAKNENHYDYANLGPDTITFTLMDDNNARLNAYDSGELDYIEDVPVDLIPTFIAEGKITIVPYIGTYYVEFQTQLEPFTDPNVRKAFNLAIDRNYIVENITRTGQVPATGFVPSGIYDVEGGAGADFRTVGGEYYSVTDESYESNCEEARALLAEAGYPGGEGFPTVVYLYNTSDAHKSIGEALQYMWQEELGVNVQLQNEEWNTFLETRKQGNYSIARGGWIADYNDPATFLDMFVTGGGNNDPQYSNPDYDALIVEIKSESDLAVRFEKLHQAEDIIIKDDMIVGPIYFYTNYYMQREDLGGIYRNTMGITIFSYAHK